MGEASQAVLRLLRAHRFLPAPIRHLCLRLKVGLPGVVGVPKDEMPVGNLFEHVKTEPFPEFHHRFLMAGAAEMTALAGESQEIFMLTIRALHPGKAVVQVAAFQVAGNDLLEVGPPEPVPPFEPLLVDLNEGLNIFT